MVKKEAFKLDKHLFVGSELYDFLKDFCSSEKEVGTYYSRKQTFIIEYGSFETPARIGQSSGIIQLDKSHFEKLKYAADLKFWLVLWCVAEFRNNDEIKSDELACDCYFETGFNRTYLLPNILNVLSCNPGSINSKRIDNLIEYFANSKDTSKRKYLHKEIQEKLKQYRLLQEEIDALKKEDLLMCDYEQWFEEKEEEIIISKRPKKTETKLIGRVHWKEEIKDDASNNIISIDRSAIVRIDGKWSNAGELELLRYHLKNKNKLSQRFKKIIT